MRAWARWPKSRWKKSVWSASGLPSRIVKATILPSWVTFIGSLWAATRVW